MTYMLLLDTSSLMYRAFFTLPTSLTGNDGQPINAVHGYLDMTAGSYAICNPTNWCMCMTTIGDRRGAPTCTRATRPTVPTTRRSYRHSSPCCARCSMRWARIRPKRKIGKRDAIGALCARADAGNRIDVITGDRDLLQLVNDGQGNNEPLKATGRVSITVKGVGEMATYDEAAVQEKYGIPPHRYIDFAILRGDPSDGLPGVKGIGEKTARSLVERYPSLDALLADADAQTPRLATNLRDATAYIAAMRQIVPSESTSRCNGTHPHPRRRESMNSPNVISLAGQSSAYVGRTIRRTRPDARGSSSVMARRRTPANPDRAWLIVRRVRTSARHCAVKIVQQIRGLCSREGHPGMSCLDRAHYRPRCGPHAELRFRAQYSIRRQARLRDGR